MWTAFIPIIGKVIDRVFPDENAKAQAKLKLFELASEGELEELKGKAKIISTEAKSEHWVAATWRPITMLIFVGLVVSYWFGYTPPNITNEILNELFSIIKIGLGGYIVGRSAEKVVKVWKEKDKN